MLTTLNELQTDMSILLASTTNNQVQLFGKKIIVKNNNQVQLFGKKIIVKNNFCNNILDNYKV